jgi:hypothetical protein
MDHRQRERIIDIVADVGIEDQPNWRLRADTAGENKEQRNAEDSHTVRRDSNTRENEVRALQ